MKKSILKGRQKSATPNKIRRRKSISDGRQKSATLAKELEAIYCRLIALRGLPVCRGFNAKGEDVRPALDHALDGLRGALKGLA